jgi:hypothetical protein
MPAPRLCSRGATAAFANADKRSRWIWRVPCELERRLYFVATLVLIAWYLVSRVV